MAAWLLVAASCLLTGVSAAGQAAPGECAPPPLAPLSCVRWLPPIRAAQLQGGVSQCPGPRGSSRTLRPPVGICAIGRGQAGPAVPSRTHRAVPSRSCTLHNFGGAALLVVHHVSHITSTGGCPPPNLRTTVRLACGRPGNLGSRPPTNYCPPATVRPLPPLLLQTRR